MRGKVARNLRRLSRTVLVNGMTQQDMFKGYKSAWIKQSDKDKHKIRSKIKNWQ